MHTRYSKQDKLQKGELFYGSIVHRSRVISKSEAQFRAILSLEILCLHNLRRVTSNMKSSK